MDQHIVAQAEKSFNSMPAMLFAAIRTQDKTEIITRGDKFAALVIANVMLVRVLERRTRNSDEPFDVGDLTASVETNSVIDELSAACTEKESRLIMCSSINEDRSISVCLTSDTFEIDRLIDALVGAMAQCIGHSIIGDVT